MKYILSLLLVALTWTAGAQWFSSPEFLAQLDSGTNGGGGGACNTLADNVTTTVTSSLALGNGAGYNYWAIRFIPASSYTACGLTLKLTASGSPTQTLNAAVFTDWGTNMPNAVIGSWSDNFAASTLTSTATDILFSGLNAPLTAGQTNWIVIKTSAIDGANYVFVKAASWTGEIRKSSGNGSTWDADPNSYGVYFKLWK